MASSVTARPGRVRGVVARLGLVCFGLLLGLALAEAATRAVGLVWCRDWAGGFWRRDERYGWGHIPGASGWAQHCFQNTLEWRVHSRMNAHGLRDRDIDYARGDAFRVLVLGDSFTEGLQVPLADTFAKRLEARLDGGRGGRRVEVVNAGVSGWGTDNALLFWRAEGWRYRPDVVVLAFDVSNDVLENHVGLLCGTRFPYPEKPYFMLDHGRLALHGFPLASEHPVRRVATETRRLLARHLAVFRLLEPVPAPAREMPGVARVPNASPADVYRDPPPPAWREAWRLTRGLVLTLGREVERRGSRFVVAVFDGRRVVAADPARAPALERPSRRLVDFLARHGVATVPVVPALRAHHLATGRTGYFDWDVHWTAEGHEVVAAALADALVRLGYTPPPR